MIETHSRDVEKRPQKCAICIMASDLWLEKGGTGNVYDTMPEFVQNFIYSSCGDAHVKGGMNCTQKIYPLLTLCIDRPCMLIENTDVDNLIANGSLCIFKGLKLRNGYQDLFKILMNTM